MELADGTTQRIVSDGSWRASTGPILKNDLFGGEVYDARLEKTGWLEAGYDDSTWAAAGRKESPGGRLEAQMIEPIRSEQGSASGETDQSETGGVRLRFRAGVWRVGATESQGARGEQDRVAVLDSPVLRRPAPYRPSSSVTSPPDTPLGSTPYRAMVDKRHHHGPDGATDFYILKGDPAGERFEPRFAFHPVRYVQLEGLTNEPAMEDLEGCVVHSSVDLAV